MLHREIVQYLVEVGGADVKLKDQLDRTPADIAKEMAQTDIMDYLNNKMSQWYALCMQPWKQLYCDTEICSKLHIITLLLTNLLR